MGDAMDVEDLVLAESRRFRACLPSLMKEHEGHWIVFHQGRVVSVHDTEDAAYIAGLETPGPGAGHVVARVCEPEDVFIGALSTGA